MKKKAVGAIVLAGLVALQMPMMALAEDINVTVNDSNVDTYATDGVIKNNITVVDNCGVYVNTKDVKIAGDVTVKDIDGTHWTAVYANGADSTKIEITGNVKNEGNGSAVGVSGNKTVTVAGDAISNTSDPSGCAVKASNGAQVTVRNAVDTKGAMNVVNAQGSATIVTVSGKVESTNSVTGAAINATKGATVTAGSVEAAKNGIQVSGDTTIVVIAGDVTAAGTGVKYADTTAPTVVIEGTLTANDLFYAETENLKNSYFYEVKKSDGSAIDSGYNCLNYIIKKTGVSDAIIISNEKTATVNEKTYTYANGGEAITFTLQSGYAVSSPLAVENADGTYTIIVPLGGGVTLEAIKKAIAAAAVDTTPVSVGSIGSAVTGTWTQNFKGEWFFTTNRQVRNSWAYIADPTGAKEGNWYRFGVSGAMLTGWQEIDGKKYYFIETPGADQGKLLMNAVTPDGKRVGADGALIQ